MDENGYFFRHFREELLSDQFLGHLESFLRFIEFLHVISEPIQPNFLCNQLFSGISGHFLLGFVQILENHETGIH